MSINEDTLDSNQNSITSDCNLEFSGSINQFLTFQQPGFTYRKWKMENENHDGKKLFLPLDRDRTAFQFNRTRIVNLPWTDLLKAGISNISTDMQFLRSALEQSWGCKPYDDDKTALSSFIIKTSFANVFEYLLPNSRSWNLIKSCRKKRWNTIPEDETIIKFGNDYFYIRPKYLVKSFSLFDNNGNLRNNWELDIEQVFIARPHIICPLHNLSKWALKTDNRTIQNNNFNFQITSIPTPLKLKEYICLQLNNIKPDGKVYFLISGSDGHDFIKNTKSTNLQKDCNFDPRFPFKRQNCRSGVKWVREKVTPNNIILVYGLHTESELSNPLVAENARFYLVKLKVEKTYSAKELSEIFTKKEEYKTFWNSILSISMVFYSTLSDEKITRRMTHGFEIANTYRAILDEFVQLDAERQVYEGSKDIKPIIDPLEPGFDLKIAKLSAVKRRLGKLDIQIARLEAKASSLGLLLATRDINNEDEINERLKAAGVPDDLRERVRSKVTNLKKGRLYKLGTKQFEEWSTYEVFNTPRKVESSNSGFLGIGSSSSSSWTTVQETREVKHRFDYQPIVEAAVDLEPWRDAKARLELSGWICHIFRLSDEGFVSQLDQSIETTLALCEASENYRERCAIFFPIYEESLIRGEPIITKYIVILAPLSGVSTIRAPQIFIEEELDYRIAWLGSELGELAGSTNLAPGETKSITITKSYSTSIEESRSSSSFQEITSARSSDIASMIENELTANSSLGSSNGFNAKVSGTYKAITGEMGTENHNNLNAASFSRYFQSIAKKATENVSRNLREEVSFTSNTSSKSEVTETVSGQISNINQGKTLNLLFYRVKNVFEGSLHFRKVRITIIGGRELIVGTGFNTSKTFDFENAREALEYLVSDKIFLKMFGINPFSLKYAAAKAINSIIDHEYVEKNKSSNCHIQHHNYASDESIERYVQADAKVNAQLSYEHDLGKKLSTIIDGRFRRLRKSSKQLEDTPLVRDIFYLPSGALYLDAMIGIKNATEEYAEEMRERELQIKDANIRKENAEALLIESKSRALETARYKIPKRYIK